MISFPIMPKERPRMFSVREIGQALVSSVQSHTGAFPESPYKDINPARGVDRYVGSLLLCVARKTDVANHKPAGKTPRYTLEEAGIILDALEKRLKCPVADQRFREFLGGSAIPLAMARIYLVTNYSD